MARPLRSLLMYRKLQYKALPTTAPAGLFVLPTLGADGGSTAPSRTGVRHATLARRIVDPSVAHGLARRRARRTLPQDDAYGACQAAGGGRRTADGGRRTADGGRRTATATATADGGAPPVVILSERPSRAFRMHCSMQRVEGSCHIAGLEHRGSSLNRFPPAARSESAVARSFDYAPWFDAPNRRCGASLRMTDGAHQSRRGPGPLRIAIGENTESYIIVIENRCPELH
ncbi:hypothetical protein FHS01_001512 [Longimicrobium terrae]|uniref:Uncharacterized protein n=1 Tax=Longimicrobium terrae TaxID=1639882 RepID=A0A841GW35_9BACT|nr:hypothetical protein [Longimicrobium terrae]MBB6069894.1 hypothetical protein [Longimicrobium terrae]